MVCYGAVYLASSEPPQSRLSKAHSKAYVKKPKNYCWLPWRCSFVIASCWHCKRDVDPACHSNPPYSHRADGRKTSIKMGSIRGASNFHYLDFHYDANLALSFGHCQNCNWTLYGRGNHSDHTHRVVRDMGHCDGYTPPSKRTTRKRCISLCLIHRIANYRYVDQLQKAVRKSLSEERMTKEGRRLIRRAYAERATDLERLASASLTWASKI